MIREYILNFRKPSIRSHELVHAWTWWFVFIFILLLTVSIGFLILPGSPDVGMIAWMIYFLGAIGILYKPHWGIYLVVFFALVGDGNMLPWFPFVKNFSSRESVLFVHDDLIVTPMESYIFLIFVVWFGKNLVMRKIKIFMGQVTFPSLVFTFFILTGLVYGLFISNGNATIALWEVRPFVYLSFLIVLTSNLFTSKEHYRNFFIWVTLAIVIESIVGIVFIFTTLGGEVRKVESVMEHAAAVHMNSLFILTLCLWIYRSSPIKKLVYLLLVPVIGLAYLSNQRRAAFISLAVALGVLGFLLYFHNRKLFWTLMPPIIVIGVLYMAAFWNSNSTIALPVQAIKSVVAEKSTSERNIQSNIYRMIENVNTSFTIHQYPLTGVGFGNKFLILVPLPDISFFAWWDYFPHNSIIYVWVKAGVGAFVSMLFFIGTVILTGAKAIDRTLNPEYRIFLVTALLYVIMHFIYAYVDISWDAQSMVYLGAVIGILNSAEHVLAKPNEIPSKRYPWQADPVIVPDLDNTP